MTHTMFTPSKSLEHTLNDLSAAIAALHAALKTSDKKSVVDLFRAMLVARDDIEKRLGSDEEGKFLEDITQADDDLYRVGLTVLDRYWINMPAWREHRNNLDAALTNETTINVAGEAGSGVVSHKVKDDVEAQRLGWWWYLDSREYTTYRLEPLERILCRTLVAVLIVVDMIFLAGKYVDNTLPQLGGLFSTLFANLGISFSGVDENMLAIGSVVVTLVLVLWRLGTSSAVNTANTINRWLRRYRWVGRQVIMFVFVPVSSLVTGVTLVATLLIIINFVFVQLILPPLTTQLETKDCLTARDLSIAPNTLESQKTLTALTKTGQCAELIGNTDEALAIYLQVLERDPDCALAQYYLAKIYIKKGEPERAFPLLDNGLSHLPSFEQLENTLRGDSNSDEPPNTEICLPVTGTKQRAILRYLLAVSRGHALLEAGYPRAATTALKEVLSSVSRFDEKYPTIFFHPFVDGVGALVEDEMPEGSGDEIGEISTLDGFYYYARSLDAWEALNPTQQTMANEQIVRYWRVVLTLAASDNLDNSQARLWRSEAQARVQG